eukprot:CAMPEP_0168402700 /NCGR_PEP_ID=MMETSP0228-20121227/23753_1 /TAXON_ID=133427 /ORGANISM="Protoceratium reticulatum, Strain CCCM 535 (=CCMP 1889)" /LENGTH=256 /DNA_ID=CAMNT_0008416289 /DNA_START=30 /DNA_END=800 /DNA_ORIENTATION=+
MMTSAMEAMTPAQMEAARYCVLIAVECALLAFLEKSTECLTNFQARKLCHAGTGLLLLQLDSRDPQARWFVYFTGLASLVMTWEVIPRIKPFRFGKARDIGMTVYMLVAMLWFYMEMPIRVLAPMFFADPAGAIVGKYLSSLKSRGFVNPVWWRGGGTTKTVGGSAAVLLLTMLSFAPPATLPQRIAIGVAAVIAEALGGAFDNLLLVIVVVGSRILLNAMEFGDPSLNVGRPPMLVPAGALAPLTRDPARSFLGY